MARKIMSFFAALVLLTAIFTLSCAAEDILAMPSGYSEVVDSLPEEIRDSLPEGIEAEDAEGFGEGLMELTSPEYLFSLLGELTYDGLGDALRLFASLCGVLVISGAFSVLKGSFRSEMLSRVLGLVSSCVIFGVVIDVQYRQIETVVTYFERLNSLMGATIPITAAVYAMGGNVGSAATHSSGMYIFLAFSEFICSRTIVPVSTITTALSFSRAVGTGVNLQSIGSAIKKIYSFSVGMIMTLLLFMLSTQTVIAAAGDSAAARAAKLVSSSVIPMVGGAVGETLRTVASGVGYLKSVVGVGGVVFVFLLLLPTLITLLMNRLAFILSESVAGLFGCDSEARLLGDIGSISGCMIAVCSMAAVMFIIAMNIFVKTTVAVM
ncbi:MAG: hypothetical protein E7641_00495 [Ruminococcaceae bacterium]|nr:hypothetical protein [Oscillospiraceae bacterium]